MATWQLLLAAAGLWALVLVAWKLRQASEMMQFLTEATDQLEGMLPQLKRDAAAFEEALKEAWQLPRVQELADHFGAPPHPAVEALWDDPARGEIQDVVLRGEGTPPEGYTLANYFAAGLRWTTFGSGLEPGEYAFAHDAEGRLYATGWTTAGPVVRVPYGSADPAGREVVAPSLAAFLAWRPEPGGV